MNRYEENLYQFSTVSIGNKVNTLIFSKELNSPSNASEKMILVADMDFYRKMLLVKTCWIKRKK